MLANRKNHHIIFQLVLALCLTPFMSPALALCSGIVLAILKIKPSNTKQYTNHALQYSIILMGFGMSLSEVIQSSRTGFMETAISVVVVMVCGISLGRLLKVERNTSVLISAGTAICGGSAIAALSPVLGSKNHQSSMALIVVFVLNAIALIIFPSIGHHFHLSQEAFGNWAALAIHDTSSVAGAGAAYGDKALQVATTVKLIRALWIIPLSITVALLNRNKQKGKIKFPWFILGFVATILIANYLPAYQSTYQHLNWLGHRGIVIALFLIGSSFSISEIKQSGYKSFILGVLLWAIIAVGSFLILNL